MSTSHRTNTANRGRAHRWVAVAALAGALAACGGGGQLPPSQLADSTRDSLDTNPTTLPLFPSDDRVDDNDTAPSNGQPDTATSGEQAEIDQTPIPNRDTVLTTGRVWVDATANLVGLESTCGNVSYLSAHSYSDDLFAGIAARGVFQLDDESGEWMPLGANAQSDQIDNRLSWIEYDPNDPNRFWEAGIYGKGVFRTDDGGATFSQVGDIDHVDFVSTDPTDPFRSTMLAGGHEDRIVYLSNDGGSSWTDIAAVLPAGVGHTAYPVVLDSSTFLLGTRRGDESGILRSEDGGATWTMLYDGPISGPPLIDGENIYWLADQGGGLVVSNDGGRSFSSRSGRIGGRPSTLSQLQDGRLLTHDETAVLISDDEGVSWFAAGPPLPFTPKGIVMSSSDTAIYAWSHTCNFGDEGNPVLPNSIVRLDVPGPSSVDDSG